MNPQAEAPSVRVYLDAASVAPVLPEAREAFLAALEEGWADPRRLHREGRRARHLLDAAREAVAAALGGHADEIVFTAGHDEAVAAAVGGIEAARTRPAPVLHGAVEHSAVLRAAAASAGGPRSLPVDRLGRVELRALDEALAGEVTPSLVCVQSANGEVGSRQPLPAVALACRARGVPLLVDAAASTGSDEGPAPAEPADLVVADPRAWGGLPGAGVLLVRRGAAWLSPAGGHDSVERSGTDPSLPAVFAAAVSLQVAGSRLAENAARRRRLVRLIREAAVAVPDTEVAGDAEDRLPHVVTFSCLYVDGEVIVEELDRRGFAIGSGSACTSSTLEPSHVLAAMGVLTHGNVRVGLPADVRDDDVARFCAQLAPAVAAVRERLGVGDL